MPLRERPTAQQSVADTQVTSSRTLLPEAVAFADEIVSQLPEGEGVWAKLSALKLRAAEQTARAKNHLGTWKRKRERGKAGIM